MFNILFVDDNLPYLKNIINFILKNNSNIRLAGIASNEKETFEYLTYKEYNIDIIILNLKLTNYTSIELLNKLGDQEYYQSVIAISKKENILSSIINEKYIYSWINELDNFDKISSELNNLIEFKKHKRNLIEEKILVELKYLKYNDKLVGTKYLLEAITLIAENQSFNSKNLKKEIYPIIASKYNKTVHNIKCNINNATIIMNHNCDKKIIMDYFRFSDVLSEAKPKQVIDTILNKI